MCTLKLKCWPSVFPFGVVRKPYRQSQTGQPVAPMISALSVPGPTQTPIPYSSRMSLLSLRSTVLAPLLSLGKTKPEQTIEMVVKIPRRPWGSFERVCTERFQKTKQVLLDMLSSFTVLAQSGFANWSWVMGNGWMALWTGYMGDTNARLTITILSLPTHHFGLFSVDTHSFEYTYTHLDI